MTNFFLGGASSNRDILFTDTIEAAVNNGKRVIVIIPDQFSFEYDKKLYNKLGAVGFNKITTLGFNRLAEVLENKYGGNNGLKYADDNVKIILMYKAIKTLRRNKVLLYYANAVDRRALEKGNFISQLIELIQEFRESGINNSVIESACTTLKGTLALKMHDFSLIYREYLKQLEEAGLKDSVSGMSSAIETAKTNEFFKDSDVFIDSFSSFTYDQLKMLEVCLSQADNVNVALSIDSDSVKNSIHSFRITETTFGTLKSLLHKSNYNIIRANETELYSQEISYAGKNLFNIVKKPFEYEPRDIRVLNADDIYSEASFVCAQIKEHIEHGYSFSDMAVILRNLSEAASVFENTMEKYDIPYFIDNSENVISSSIVQYFNLVFNCLTSKNYRTENILKLVKSPFYTQNKHTANLIESYCIKWNIDGQMWTQEYFGLDLTLVKSESELKHIQTVESIRKAIINPFEKIKHVCSSGEVAASKICELFFNLLDEIGVSKRTYSVVKKSSLSDNQTQIELSRNLRQLWNMILSAVKSIYDVLKNEPITMKQFFELFRVMVSQMKLSLPPQKADCVIIANAAHSRLNGVKIAFICQVNDGVFPQTISNNSLLSRTDMSQLQDALSSLSSGLKRDFLGDVKYTLMNEEFSCYNAVSTATEKLYISYINADLTGEEKRPSILINDIKKCFPNIVDEKISDIPLDFFCKSTKTAFHIAVEHFKDKDTIIASIKASLNDTKYNYKLNSLANSVKNGYEGLKTLPDSKASESIFFKDSTATISASQVDSYYKCPFAYYCRYGLRLKPIEVMEMSPNHIGTLVHMVLEKVFSCKDENGKLLFLENEMHDECLNVLISECFENYYTHFLNGKFGKTSTFTYNFERLKFAALRIVKYVLKEISLTKYTTYATEYSFGPDSGEKLIEFTTDGGRKLSVTGSIDRVDTSKDSDNEYVRIIDYKTGAITIDYAHLECGLNLQMLVYLDAYMKSEGVKSTRPAGIEYMSFGGKIKKFRDSSVPESEYEISKEKNIIKAYKPKGLIVSDGEIVSCFNKNNSNPDFEYAPFEKNAKGTISSDEFDAIREYANSKVVEFGNALESGRFPMKPVGSVCNYCDYRVICNKDKYEDTSGLADNKKELEEQFKERLNEIIANKDGEI